MHKAKVCSSMAEWYTSKYFQVSKMIIDFEDGASNSYLEIRFAVVVFKKITDSPLPDWKTELFDKESNL